MIKYLVILSFFCLDVSAQTVEIQGKAKISDVSDASPTAQVVAIESDGTLSVMPNSSAMPPSIGDFAYGGVVFWMSADGKHGKVVAVNNAGYRSWSNVTSGDAAFAFTDVNGPARTLEIVKQSGHTSSAAQNALDFFYAGFDDWYLPTKTEGEHIFNNWGTLNATITAHSGFALDDMWTSSEFSSTEAWFTRSSGQSEVPKIFSNYIRPVRSFWVED